MWCVFMWVKFMVIKFWFRVVIYILLGCILVRLVIWLLFSRFRLLGVVCLCRVMVGVLFLFGSMKMLCCRLFI